MTSINLYQVLAIIKYLGGRGCPCDLIYKWLELLEIRTEANKLGLGCGCRPFWQIGSERADPRTVGPMYAGFQHYGLPETVTPSLLGSLGSHPQMGETL